jgi:chromosome segregation ATPase
LTQERDSLRSEHEELKVNFTELESKCSALTEDLNAMKGKCDALQRDKDNLIGLEATLRMMVEEDSSIEEAHLLELTQERNSLRSEHETLKVNFTEFESKYSALTEDLNVIKGKCDALQREKDHLVRLEATLKMIVQEDSSIEEAHLLELTQERDSLRSEHEELNVNFNELESKCSALTEYLNAIKGKCDGLQRDRDNLLGLEATLRMMVEEDSSIQEAHLLELTQERDSLRSENEELKFNFNELESKCSAMTEDLNAIRGKGDSLQMDKDNLIGLESTLRMMVEEDSSIEDAHLLELIRERDSLRSEHEVLKVNFTELESKCSALTEDLNAIKGKCDALQRDKDNLIGLEATLRMMVEEDSSIQEAHLLELSQERESLRSENEEPKINFSEVKSKCRALTEVLNAIKGKCDSLQRDKDNLIHLEATLKMVEEDSNIWEAHHLSTRWR